MRMVKIVAVWTLQILVGVIFVMLGVMKFRDPIWMRNFARWGYPDGFYMVVGVLEAAGGVALLIPRVTTYASWLLMAVMAGAALTHVVHGELQRFPVPFVYLLLIALVWWLRRKPAAPARVPAAERQAVV